MVIEWFTIELTKLQPIRVTANSILFVHMGEHCIEASTAGSRDHKLSFVYAQVGHSLLNVLTFLPVEPIIRIAANLRDLTATVATVCNRGIEFHFLSVTHNIIIVRGRDTLGQNLKQNLKKLDFIGHGFTVFPSSYPLARPILSALQAEAKHRLESGRFQKVAKLSKIKSQADRLRLAVIKSPPDSLNSFIIIYYRRLSRVIMNKN